MISDMLPRLRRALGVSASYDDNELTDMLQSAVRKLLRDYNFPKSKRRAYLGTGTASTVNGGATLALSDLSFPLPTGFKKEGVLFVFDPTTGSFTPALTKAENFRFPQLDGLNKFYWLEDGQVWLDNPIDSDTAGYQLVMLYQSNDVSSNESWITDEFEDAVFYVAATRGAVDVRKPELAQTYGTLWKDEQETLAIFLNELEWDGVEMLQRERIWDNRGYARYPVNSDDCLR